MILNLIHLVSQEKYNNSVITVLREKTSNSKRIVLSNISSPQKHTTLTYIEFHGIEIHLNITYFLTLAQDATGIWLRVLNMLRIHA